MHVTALEQEQLQKQISESDLLVCEMKSLFLTMKMQGRDFFILTPCAPISNISTFLWVYDVARLAIIYPGHHRQ